MPRTLRLDEIRLRCQRRADKESDPSIGTAEWNALISEQYGDLSSEVEKTGMRYFESKLAIVATGAASYAAPSDHLSTLGVYRVDASGGLVELEEIMVQERTRWAGRTGDASCYDLVGATLTLYPRPSSGSYEMVYMPQAPDLSLAPDSTLIDVVTADGEAFLIWGVAVKAKAKSEAGVGLEIKEREEARARLVSWATNRAFTQPRRPIVRQSLNSLMDVGDTADDPGGWWDR